VWSQAEPLGDGFVARAETTIAPVAKASGARRVLLLIDGSRSMELVGEPAVTQVVHAIAAALPARAEVEAVIFDRTAARVLGSWKPADPATLAAIDSAVHAHVPGNGSDAVAAFALAHNLIADTRGEAMIITITDGALGTLEPAALANALDSRELAADVHTIVLDRGHLTAQTPEPLRTAVTRYGGSYVEVSADELTSALAEIDSWLRPSAAVGGTTLLAGTGTVALSLARGPAKGTAAPLAQLVLATATAGDDPDLEKQLARLTARHPWANGDYAFSVLATKGTVARARRDTVAGGGPFTRMVDVPDPPYPPEVAPPRSPYVSAASIDKQILDTLFRLQLQPAAYVCYQRAIGRVALAGTVAFHLEISRGEVTSAAVEGLGDATFDACLLDAAYRLVPPMPDPSYNADDRSIVNYPLTFQIHEQHPLVIPGDADSSSPLDIDAIKGGPPPHHVTPVDTKTPLGNLRPTVQAPPARR
jgi:Mg-chelatase subunit ChlD